LSNGPRNRPSAHYNPLDGSLLFAFLLFLYLLVAQHPQYINIYRTLWCSSLHETYVAGSTDNHGQPSIQHHSTLQTHHQARDPGSRPQPVQLGTGLPDGPPPGGEGS
uniref:Uncharacterized protein n=1 Tax=Oncorhynchus tshawytscha TaxID=74940 RepID=A0AAZ3R4C6_ONCTS